LKVTWGRGRMEGSFALSLEIGGTAFRIMTIWAIGAVEVQFQMLKLQQPFADKQKRQELAERLEQVEGVRIPISGLSGRPRIPLTTLGRSQSMAHFIQAM